MTQEEEMEVQITIVRIVKILDEAIMPSEVKVKIGEELRLLNQIIINGLNHG